MCCRHMAGHRLRIDPATPPEAAARYAIGRGPDGQLLWREPLPVLHHQLPAGSRTRGCLAGWLAPPPPPPRARPISARTIQPGAIPAGHSPSQVSSQPRPHDSKNPPRLVHPCRNFTIPHAWSTPVATSPSPTPVPPLSQRHNHFPAHMLHTIGVRRRLLMARAPCLSHCVRVRVRVPSPHHRFLASPHLRLSRLPPRAGLAQIRGIRTPLQRHGQ